VQTPTKSTRRSTLHLNPTDYALQCPSGKTNLPNNVVVTRVNVEAADWVPGLGEIVQGTSRDYVEPLKRVVAVPVAVVAAPVAVKPVQERTIWAAGAWPTASDLESIWDSLRILPKEQGKEGDRVAVKVRPFLLLYPPLLTISPRCSNWDTTTNHPRHIRLPQPHSQGPLRPLRTRRLHPSTLRLLRRHVGGDVRRGTSVLDDAQAQIWTTYRRRGGGLGERSVDVLRRVGSGAVAVIQHCRNLVRWHRGEMGSVSLVLGQGGRGIRFRSLPLLDYKLY
jgi:hypothetical protein